MPTSTTMFPFDPTGSKASNLITREQQVLSPPIAHSDYHLLIPKLAPFFSDGLIVKHQDSGRVLQEGIDYELTHHHRRASWAIMKPVYGSVLFSDRTLKGVIEFTYQTLGGEWTVDGAKITQVLSTKLVQPRTTTWEQIVTDSIPCEFPPIDHQWNLHDMVGMTDVKEAIDNLSSTLEAHLEPFNTVLAHLDDKSNPHEVNKAQVKLGNVENHPISTRSQAENGTHHASYMTPLRTHQAFDEFMKPYDAMIATITADLADALKGNQDDYNAKFSALRRDMADEDNRVEGIARSLNANETNERKTQSAYLLSLVNKLKLESESEYDILSGRIDDLGDVVAVLDTTTNLSMGGSGNNRTVESSTGDHVNIPIASGTTAGFMAIGHHNKLDSIKSGAERNVPTDLSMGGSGNNRIVESSTGTHVNIPLASASTAGFLSMGLFNKLSNIETGAEKNQPTTASRTLGSTTTLLQAKAMNDHRTSADHDDRYYTKAEINTILNNLDMGKLP